MSKRTRRRADDLWFILAIGAALSEATVAIFARPDRFQAIFWPMAAAWWCFLLWTERRRTR